MEIKFLIKIWLGYILLILGIVFLVIRWAIKNDQFKENDRAGMLPLEIEEETD